MKYHAATNVNLFKARLDMFWMNQDVKYDFTADLTGTGDRFEYKQICETRFLIFYIVCYVDTDIEVFYTCIY